MKFTFIAVLLSIVLVACQKSEIVPESGQSELYGSWTNPQYSDSIVTYTRIGSLIENQYGMLFSEGNKFTNRDNSGFCGTPPISTTDYEGTWTINNSVIEITVPFWGGVSHKTWKVISLENEKLVIYPIKVEYQPGK